MPTKRTVGIIGIGPRGGYALECLVSELIKQKAFSQIEFLLFEKTGQYGNGQVYTVDQAESNWININERILELDQREELSTEELSIPSFPSYHHWRVKDFQNLPEENVDTYPSRAKIGEYLKERFQTFITPLIQSKIAVLHTECVTELSINSTNDITIVTNSATYENISEVLLTIGHQPTQLDDQIKNWSEFSQKHDDATLFQSAYPIENILSHQKLNPESKIGIRGFGLAAIDTIRAVALKFGEFKVTDEDTLTCQYQSNYRLESLFIPFSLDGLPQVPKPLNAKVDKLFEPTEEQISSFESVISDPVIQKEASSTAFILNAFAPIAANVYSRLSKPNNGEDYTTEEIEKTMKAWLEDQNYEHPTILNQNLKIKETLKAFSKMACGKKPASLDFCVGQVWRHLQPTFYKALSYNHCSKELVADIVALDESTKRYSFGPPVESIQQLIALIEAGILNPKLLDNPEVELTDKGWKIVKADNHITAGLMIDSVLDSPKVEIVNSNLVKRMLSNELIEPLHDDLGVITDDQNYLVCANDKKLPIALLGRLAKGTIIGVDAILECFGERPKKWASKAAQNHVNWRGSI